ncbi:MAG TPA: DUF4252 domain-containing protein [Bacteroidales bacterium]|mgnify:CR=1 FL=1|nr:DUF4252 domain-containing protein [Bacteroidales bacterium]
MKKLTLIILVAVLPVFAMAQKTPFTQLYDKYVSEPGIQTTQILPGSTSFEWEKTADNTAIREMLNSIESIRIMKIQSDSTKVSPEKIWKNMQKAASEDAYREILTISADKVQMRMLMLRGEEGRTREVALIAREGDGVFMMTMTGNMDFSSIFSPENMKNFREIGEYYLENHSGCNKAEE